ncbi:hypothetical protein F5884DRAFT_294676 [Xylogone sp. PMI_703]|nr:hypothetical protein F5884DRAFT_294676 [Xylogone sp. PMI_703]
MNAMPTLEEDEVATELRGLKKAYRNILGGGKGKKTKRAKKEKQQSITDIETEDVVAGGQDRILITNGSLNGNTDQVVEAGIENIGSAKEQPPSQRTLRSRSKGITSTDAEPSEAELAVIAPLANGDDDSKKEDKNKNAENLLMKLTPITLDEVEKAFEGDAPKSTSVVDQSLSDDDSFIGQIIARSPAKPVSRIEDSVEALDELEEVLEALDQVAMAERTLSSGVSKKLSPHPKNLKSAKHQKPEQHEVNSHSVTKDSNKSVTLARHGSVQVKSTVPKQNIALKRSKSVMIKENDANSTSRETPTPENDAVVQGTKRTGVKRPASLLPPKPLVKATKPATLPTFELPGEAVARKLKEQREARLAQRANEQSPPKPAVISTPKVKSTKPPTKPTFELPGEAISRKKKEALEARLKAEEEEDRKRREFKARPILGSVPTHVPRETITSRARQSKIGVENSENDGSMSSKHSPSTGTHRLSVANLAQANMTTSRASGPAPTLSRKTSSIASVPRTISPTDVQIQRQRAKEIYDRDAKYTEDHERERREREANAKRSREEAAERGRQASREWAEKQRAKRLLEAEKMRGGQMALKP